MKKNIIALIVLIVVGLVIVFTNRSSKIEPADIQIVPGDVVEEVEVLTETLQDQGLPPVLEKGEGVDTKHVYPFTQSEFDKALSDGHDVLVYFFADWCPSCRAELESFDSSLSKVDRSGIRVFKVNVEDPRNATDEEKAFAKEYDATRRHTKIWIKGGQEVLFDSVQYNEDRYLLEFENLLGLVSS